MKPGEVFKRYDIRGHYPEEIDEKFSERLGKALGTLVLEEYSGKVVVGKDNKESSSTLKQSLVSGLRSAGVDVLDAGTGPTDCVALAGVRNKAVSVQVTSSHLPLDTNGFKLMYPQGNGFLNPDLDKVQELFLEEVFEDGDGGYKDISEESREHYFESSRDFFHQYFDSIDRKVVVDTLGGAATGFLPQLLEELGAEVVDIAAEKKADRPYVDPPEPDPEKLSHVEARVSEEDADLALATDMDADRLAVYYEGEWISGSEVLAVLAQVIKGDVVATIDTSKTVEEIVEKRGDNVYYTRVGDPFLVDEALEREVSLAGEANRHYCFPAFVPYNSGTAAGLLIAAIGLESKLEKVPDYYTETSSVEIEDRDERMEAVAQYVRENYEVVNDIDGMKFRREDAEVLIRSSGSSPKLRMTVESSNEEAAQRALQEAREIIQKA